MFGRNRNIDPTVVTAISQLSTAATRLLYALARKADAEARMYEVYTNALERQDGHGGYQDGDAEDMFSPPTPESRQNPSADIWDSIIKNLASSQMPISYTMAQSENRLRTVPPFPFGDQIMQEVSRAAKDYPDSANKDGMPIPKPIIDMLAEAGYECIHEGEWWMRRDCMTGRLMI